MGGMGAFLGGALQGIGAGLAAEGRQRWEDRREMALQQLRGQQAAELAGKQHANRKDEIATQAQFDNWKDSQKTERTTASRMVLGKAEAEAKSAAASAEQRRNVAMEVLKSKLAISEKAHEAANEARLRLGEPEDLVFDDEGNGTMIFKGGKAVPVGKVGQTAAGKRAASPGSGGVLAEVAAGRAGGGQALPAPSAAPRSVMIFDPKTGEFIQAGER